MRLIGNGRNLKICNFMIWINKNLENEIKGRFPDRNVVAYCEYRTWQSSRYLYVRTILNDDKDIYYRNKGGVVELLIEGKYKGSDYKNFVRNIVHKTSRNKRLRWQGQYCCRIEATIDNIEQLVDAFKDIMEIIDPLISDNNISINEAEPYEGDTDFKDEVLSDDEVCLTICSLGTLFGNILIIPEYQRNYCWEDKQVINLWESMQEIPHNNMYHLGTIILQKDKDGNYSIIDGQQRLVTLTLLVRELHYKGNMPLLEQNFLSESSKQHISNSRWLLRQLTSRSYDTKLCSRIINNLFFTVLILREERLDLAYTFFSNENSKGVPLSDYDLLKAHHLRYIFVEEQAEHVAKRWNNLIVYEYPSLDKTLATHLFRLRKWMRKKNYNPDERFCVKEEFSSALIIPEIPPFGEKFEFYEKIQGGSHFFAYAEYFVCKFNLFSNCHQIKALRNHLKWESHWKYADVIETLLFGYYLKFGEQYLTEALFCISNYIAQHRYKVPRALVYKIREYANDSEIIMMIDQASSPTFFLAECMSNIKCTGKDIEEHGIAMRFYQALQDLFAELNNHFTDLTIQKKYNNEFI